MAGQRYKIDEILSSHSTEVQDIMGHVPNWIIRWGITVIALILAAFLVFAFIFKYPDMITAEVIVSGVNPPAPVVARVEGRLRDLLVEDGRAVAANTPLAVLENPASSKDALNLQKVLAALPAGWPTPTRSVLSLRQDAADLSPDWFADPKVLTGLDFPRKLALGACQSAYEEFNRAYEEYSLFIRLRYSRTKIASLHRQQADYQKIVANQSRQVQILQEDYELLQNQFKRSKELLDQGFASIQEHETKRAQLLQKEYDLTAARSVLSDSRMRLEQMSGDVFDILIQHDEKAQQYVTQLQNAQRNLSSQLGQWDQTFVLRAPVAGRVSMARYWSSNQYVKQGDMVMTLIPPGAPRLIGKVQLPLMGAGKVKTGQRVNLRFDDYPYIEFGTVPGEVRSKSLVPSENFYTVDIDLPQGLKTNYSRKLPATQQLKGEAEIITDDISLMVRLFNPLRSLFMRHTD